MSVDRRRPPRVRPQSTRTASTASMTTVCIASKSEVVPHQRENKTKVVTYSDPCYSSFFTTKIDEKAAAASNNKIEGSQLLPVKLVVLPAGLNHDFEVKRTYQWSSRMRLVSEFEVW